MLSPKATVLWGHTIYTRKDRRAHKEGYTYGSYLHYRSRSRVKPVRKVANRRLRRYKGDVGDHGWYKKFEEVWYIVY